MRRKGTDEIELIDDEGSADLITIQSKGSGTADALHIEHPELNDAKAHPSLAHRILDIFRRPFLGV
jgi:hypothetical protein